jgi:hypothetical protein
MEISNKFLAFLLVFAIVISLAGTWYNISRLSKIPMFTGYGVQGFVNVTITGLGIMNVTSTDCNFGSGYLNTTVAGYTGAASGGLLESNGTIVNWTGNGVSTGIVLSNDGNVNLSVMVASQKNVTGFWGSVYCNATSPIACNYSFWVTNRSTDTGACGGTAPTYPGRMMNTSNISVCSNLGYDSSHDEINVSCRLVVSSDIPPAVYTDIWNFNYSQL